MTEIFKYSFLNKYKARARLRSSNFTTFETNCVLRLYEKHKDVLDSKRCDLQFSAAKDLVWNDLADEYNSLPGTQHRSIECLKNHVKNIKKKVRRMAEIENDSDGNVGTLPALPSAPKRRRVLKPKRDIPAIMWSENPSASNGELSTNVSTIATNTADTITIVDVSSLKTEPDDTSYMPPQIISADSVTESTVHNELTLYNGPPNMVVIKTEPQETVFYISDVTDANSCACDVSPQALPTSKTDSWTQVDINDLEPPSPKCHKMAAVNHQKKQLEEEILIDSSVSPKDLVEMEKLKLVRLQIRHQITEHKARMRLLEAQRKRFECSHCSTDV